MKFLIAEDEDLAAWGLQTRLQQVEPTMEVAAVLDSVKAAVAWLRSNPMPDLAFFDIQLADGLSFEIFEQVQVTCPVVFTTAYDAYALKAFQVNGIDYLLKPVSAEDLARSLEKLRRLRAPAAPDAAVWRQMMESLAPKQYKTRFMVRIGDHLQAVDTAEVDFFFGENKTVWLRHRNGRKYVVDYTLEQLDDMLDPRRFFRLNRQYIAAIDAIADTVVYSNSRLKVVLKDPVSKDEVLISREKVEGFKQWLGK